VKTPLPQQPPNLHATAQPADPLAISAATYPGVARIEVRWQKQVLGSGWHQQQREPWHVLDPQALGEFIDCPDPNCFGGGCCIGAVIRDMVAMKFRQRRGRVRCKGQKGSDGKRRWRLCITVFKYEVRVAYQDDALVDDSGILGDVAQAAAHAMERRAG
jgi:hypothetical protein